MLQSLDRLPMSYSVWPSMDASKRVKALRTSLIDSTSTLASSAESSCSSPLHTPLLASTAICQPKAPENEMTRCAMTTSAVASDADNFSRLSSSGGTPALAGVHISYEMTPFSSTLSSLHPVCRICQTATEKNNILLSPCRCDGTLKYVHGTCLRVSDGCDSNGGLEF